MKRNKVISTMQAYLFMLPAIVLLIVFVYGPLISSIGFSFCSFENFLPSKFVGLKNFNDAFADKLFRNSINLTFQWVILNMFLPTFAGLVLALLIEFFTKRRIFTNVVRTVLFVPMMMSLVAVGLLWSLIYDPNIGIVAGILKALGVSTKYNALGNAKTALYMTYIPVLWQSAGFSMVIFSAALQGISQDMIEASIVEGANKFARMRYVMIPSIMDTIMMVLMINMISGFKAFDLLYVLTKGGPGASTNITAVYAYSQAFFSYRFEYSSTMLSLLLFCVIAFVLVFSVLQRKIESRFGA